MNSEAESILIPDLHDGERTGIALVNKKLILYCSTVTGERYKLSFLGLRRLRAENVREGNLIFETNIYQDDIPTALVKKAFGEENIPQPP